MTTPNEGDGYTFEAAESKDNKVLFIVRWEEGLHMEPLHVLHQTTKAASSRPRRLVVQFPKDTGQLKINANQQRRASTVPQAAAPVAATAAERPSTRG